MQNTPQGIAKENIEKWSLLGHEPVHARGVVRLKDFRKSFPDDLLVKVFSDEAGAWVPVLLKGSGQPLKACEILPERADLALNDDGRVLRQGDFESRYKLYLDAWVYPEEGDPNWEPIPNVIDYICETPDTYSESNGYIEVNFDPKLNQKFKPKQLFGPDGETEAEYLENKAKANKADSSMDEMMKAILSGLTPEQKIEALERMARANGIPLVGEADAPEEGEEAEFAPPEKKKGRASKVKVVAPCGGSYTEGYFKSHARFCRDPECKAAADSEIA